MIAPHAAALCRFANHSCETHSTCEANNPGTASSPLILGVARQCERQATWRIELHDEVELPSIAKGIAQTRGSMVSTCMQHWSEPYVSCLEGAPSLGFAEACESVGRVRKP